MEKPGEHNIRVGLVWLVGGSVLTVGSFLLFQGAGGILFYGAIMVGGLQLVLGMGQRAHYAFLSDDKKAAKHAQAAVTTLVRCMAMVALSDGHLADSEIATIRAIYSELTGGAASEREVRAIVNKLADVTTDPAEFVASVGRQATAAARVEIVKACYMVMVADGEVSADECSMLCEILDGLGLPREPVLEGLGLVAA